MRAIRLMAAGACILAAACQSPRWDSFDNDPHWRTTPEHPPEGRAGARVEGAGHQLEIGLYTPPPSVLPPHPAPTPGASDAKASVAFTCTGSGSWCTVRFQIWAIVAPGERLKIRTVTGSGQIREVFIPRSTNNPDLFVLSTPGCAACSIEFSFEDGGNGQVESWAQIFVGHHRCGDHDETNDRTSLAGGMLYDANGRILVASDR